MRIAGPEAAAIVIHNAVENVAHTEKFIGATVDEERLINSLADMVFHFLLHGDRKG